MSIPVLDNDKTGVYLKQFINSSTQIDANFIYPFTFFVVAVSAGCGIKDKLFVIFTSPFHFFLLFILYLSKQFFNQIKSKKITNRLIMSISAT